MPLTKRNYEAIAEIINNLTVGRSARFLNPILYQGRLITDLAAYFLEDNSRFDAERFEAACTREVSNASQT
jgi:hypothetical protein